MAEQLELGTFVGAHPNTAQLVEQLRAWGFRQRRVEGVHLVFRGPHGGTLRVLRSLIGRADVDVVAKAARLLDVEPSTFWTGPHPNSGVDTGSGRGAGRCTAPAGGPTTRVMTQDAAMTGDATRNDGGRATSRDQIIAQVLAVHVAMDQPLSLGQVIALCDEQLSRAQVSGASSQLCRDGQLLRIRTGVYQWAVGSATGQHLAGQHLAGQHLAGQHLAGPHLAGPHPDAAPEVSVPEAGAPAPVRRPVPSRPLRSAPAPHPSRSPALFPPARPVSVTLFQQLFPRGVCMTAEMVDDLEQWTRLTEKLARNAATA